MKLVSTELPLQIVILRKSLSDSFVICCYNSNQVVDVENVALCLINLIFLCGIPSILLG